MQKYIMLDHTSDIGIEVWGRTKKTLFTNAVVALFDLMIIFKHVDAVDEQKIIVEGENIEDLLINFLREALYLFNGKHWLFNKCQITQLTAKRMEAKLRGEPYSPGKHTIKKEIKAVTYHSLEVVKTHSGWKAKVIFDV